MSVARQYRVKLTGWVSVLARRALLTSCTLLAGCALLASCTVSSDQPVFKRVGPLITLRVGLGRAHVRHQAACPVTLASMAVSSPIVVGPNTAPAMCPVRSITSVVGVPAIGTTDVKSSVITEPASLTLG